MFIVTASVAARMIAEALYLVLLVVLPAALNPLGVLAFEPLKASMLRAGAALLAAAWLVYRFCGGSRLEVGSNPVVRAGIAVIALAALSTALSIEPALSFFGSFDRGMGWLSLAAGGVLLITGADLFADERRRERAVRALVLGAAVPCAYALVQRAGLDPLHWTDLGAPGSTLASPTFLGGYLVMVAPFAAYLVISHARDASLVYAGWLALAIAIAGVTVLTTIRAPLLGLIAGVMTFAALARGRRRIGRLEIAAASGLLVLALALAIAAAGPSGIAGLQRFTNIARASDSSVERLTTWQDALRLPLGNAFRIVLGYGPEAQQALFERAEATVRITQSEQWDRAHDLLLDTWLTGGLAGVAALLVLLVSAVRATWAARDRARLLSAAVLAALVAHLVETAFAFETVVTSALFWAILALAAGLSTKPASTIGRGRPRLAIVAGVAGLAVAPLLVTPAAADALYGSARRSDYLAGAQLKEVAAAWAPWVEELPRSAALDWQQVASRRNDPSARARAEADLQTAARRAPFDPVPRLRLTRFYLAQDQLEQAEQACQAALTLAPYRASAWDACTDVSRRSARADEAAARRARAEELRRAP